MYQFSPKIINFILVALIGCFIPLPTITAETGSIKADVELAIEYRIDSLRWNIAGDLSGANPNILSELTWNDLRIVQTSVKSDIAWYNFLFQGMLGYGWIVDGRSQDSDFLEDNRTNEISRFYANVGGWVYDASIGGGYHLPFWSDRMDVSVLAGLSVHRQAIRMHEGIQVIPSSGPLLGLDSTYETWWKGAWIGIELSVRVSRRCTLGSALQCNFVQYYAVANWNLRTDLSHPESFEHEAIGKGFVLSSALGYVFNPRCTLLYRMCYEIWSTSEGVDRTFFVDGSAIETQLNEVSWKSFAVMIIIRFELREVRKF